MLNYDSRVSKTLNIFSSTTVEVESLPATKFTAADDEGFEPKLEAGTETLWSDGDLLSLFDVLNHCKTRMGTRLLRKWVQCPQCEYDKVLVRQSAVEIFYFAAGLRCSIRDSRDALQSFPDFDTLGKELPSQYYFVEKNLLVKKLQGIPTKVTLFDLVSIYRCILRFNSILNILSQGSL